MAHEEHLKILKQGAGQWNKWRLENAIRPDLGGANLKGADLMAADLSGADLSGADLWHANLIGANLIGVNLMAANLSSANLYGADLSGADLTDADLRYTGLGGGRLHKCHDYRLSYLRSFRLERDLGG